MVGNSLGGWLALQVAALGRALSVTALCPAGLWPAPSLAEGPVVRGRAHRVVKRLGPALPLLLASRRVRRVVLAAFVADPDKVPYRATVRMLRSYGRATAYDATATAMRQSHFAAGTEVGVPVTVAFGERDRLIRPVRSGIRDARTVMLPGCGHIPMWDAPPLVAAVIRETAESAVPAPVDGSLTAT
ncbi:MAG: alpha/beta fold hydrolase [Solirubrobacterales bacterium]|nr:alpha/beta fold hydrolase [Solirubrobacterales bacterium]